MMTSISHPVLRYLVILCAFACVFSVQAEEIDFSCVKEQVNAKTRVTQRYQEYDVSLKNQCPGSVYWSMCIERIHPWTSEIMDTLTPSGQVLVDKKFRINLQMMKILDEKNDREAFEEFYVNFSYGIDSVKPAQCVAKGCEQEKKSLRTKVRANDTAWQKARKDLAKRIEAECPKSGWGDTDLEECRKQVKKAGQPKLNEFAEQDKQLKQQLSEVNPERCEVQSG